MPQADGTGTLWRISLRVLRGEGDSEENFWYRFLINPEEYKETHPQRVSTFRTREATVVEDFGTDIPTIEFSGTTGFRTHRGKNGLQRLKELKDIVAEHAESGSNTEPGDVNSTQFIFYNNTDEESWYVHLDPAGLSISRSVQEPLLYKYSIRLVVLRRVSEPEVRDVDSAYIGNRINSEDYQTTSEAVNPDSNQNVYENHNNNLWGVLGVA